MKWYDMVEWDSSAKSDRKLRERKKEKSCPCPFTDLNLYADHDPGRDDEHTIPDEWPSSATRAAATAGHACWDMRRTWWKDRRVDQCLCLPTANIPISPVSLRLVRDKTGLPSLVSLVKAKV